MHSGNINNLLYYYFPEALSTLLFSGKISLDNICTEKIVSKSFKFIKNRLGRDAGPRIWRRSSPSDGCPFPSRDQNASATEKPKP